ncbi:hypothetical protein PoB_004574000 [Plakobranchus ocellatus]|uniref:Uncharacterized protein n=1 Tax=Plakobranchus ocellatus TaxID=259542 RepID=A0AAV4BIA0_9GAST|nr:hypothetical protein PoB_004574000 [Plakobranchus ocellatus]
MNEKNIGNTGCCHINIKVDNVIRAATGGSSSALGLWSRTLLPVAISGESFIWKRRMTGPDKKCQTWGELHLEKQILLMNEVRRICRVPLDEPELEGVLDFSPRTPQVAGQVIEPSSHFISEVNLESGHQFRIATDVA